MRRLRVIVLLAVLSFLLTGCLKQDVTVEMERNGGGTVACTFSISQKLYEELVGKGIDPFEGKDYLTTENRGEVWYSVTDATECATNSEMEAALLALQFPRAFIDDSDQTSGVDMIPLFTSARVVKETTLFTATYVFSVTVNSQAATSGGFVPDAPYRLMITVSIPGDEVVEIIDGEFADGKAVFKTASVNEFKSYSVTTTGRRWGMIIFVTVGSAVALAGLIWLPSHLQKRQRRGNRNYL